MWREKNREHDRERHKKWAEANPEKVKESWRKSNEKRKVPPKPLLTQEEIEEKNRIRKEKGAEYFQENKDWLQDNRTKYYRENKVKSILRGTKSRAKEKGLPFNIDESDIVIPEVCPVLNIPIYPNTSRGGTPNSPSIDRMIPELGYTKGNVKIISNRANFLKSNMTYEEGKLILKYLKEIWENSKNTD